jgi:UDP-2,3-diacylglucosamine hydrolase
MNEAYPVIIVSPFTFARFSYIVISMRKVFLADAHLRKPEDFNYRTLLKFLSGLKANTEELFILGDLFEFWIGYRSIPFSHYIPVLELLQELSDSGTAIIYFEGNHDFHMGPFFEETLGVRVYCDPKVLSIDGKMVYFCHGDEIISSDYGYRMLRFMLHNRLVKAIFPMIPYRLTSLIAECMSRQSKGNHEQRNRKWDYETILKDFAATRFQCGCDIVVTGHFHTPCLDTTGTGKTEKVLLSLGDWINQFSYGEWVDGKIYLRTFTP